jgi:multidrug resistance efflux pump
MSTTGILATGKITADVSGKIDPEEADQALDQGAATYSEALARKTQAQAQREELKLAIAQGEVVRISDVRQAQEKINGIIRSRLLAMPGKLAPILLGLGSASAIKAKLETEVYEVLSELAGHAAGGRS